MKAITLTQPWATLMAIGAKTIETRSWPTNHRGWLAIHAAKAFPTEARVLCATEPFRSALTTGGVPSAADLPLGVIVAVGRLQACIRTPDYRQTRRYTIGPHTRELPPPLPEMFFGDYSPGRFAWVFSTVRRLPEPVPWRGESSLWDTGPDLDAALWAWLQGQPLPVQQWQQADVNVEGQQMVMRL